MGDPCGDGIRPEQRTALLLIQGSCWDTNAGAEACSFDCHAELLISTFSVGPLKVDSHPHTYDRGTYQSLTSVPVVRSEARMSGVI